MAFKSNPFDPNSYKKPTDPTLIGYSPANPLTGSGGFSQAKPMTERGGSSAAPIPASAPAPMPAPAPAPTPASVFNPTDFVSSDPTVQAKIAQMTAAASARTQPQPAAQDTIGSIYNAPVVNQDMTDAERRYLGILNESTAPVSESDIRSNVTARFQSELDALDKLYAEKKAEAARQGIGRIGQATAIEARRGLIGSDFGTAQTAKVQEYNQQIQNAIDVEKQAQISSILSQVENTVADELAQKTAARKAGAEEYLNYLSNSEARKKQNVEKYVADLVSLDAGTPENIKALAERLGTTESSIQAEFNRQFQAAQPEQQKTITVAPGSSIFDPNTGSFIGTAPERPADNKPITQAVDGNLLQYNPSTGGWETIYAKTSGTKSLTPEQQIKMIEGGYSLDDNGNVIKTGLSKDAQQNESVATTLDAKVSLIDELLNSPAIPAMVGPRGLARISVPFANTAEKQNFAAGVQQLVSQATLDTLVDLKKQGGSLGALSEKELAILQGAASKINTWAQKDKDGNFTGKFEISEELFKKELEKIKSSTSKVIEELRKANVPSTENIDEFLNSFDKPLSKGVNGSVQQIAAAIKKVESNGNYNAKGASGEFGAYQFMPATWSGWAKQYLGDANAPMTPENQDRVANAKISDLLAQGYNAEQIALIWNGGTPKAKKGVNSKGVAYDSGAYAQKVLNALG